MDRSYITRREFVAGASAIGAASSLGLVPAAAHALSPSKFVWTKVSSAIAIPTGDGMGSCVLRDKMYSVGGWYETGISHNKVFYSSDGANWTESSQQRTWSGRHFEPVVKHKDRMWVIGGDWDDLHYEPNIHSWDGLESSPWQLDVNYLPALNRVGHWGLSLGGYLWFGGGQTAPPMTQGTEFFSDRWRSTDGITWELFDNDCVLGARGFLRPAILDGEAYFVSGGTYQTTDYSLRSYSESIMVMGGPPDFQIRCVNPKSQMPGMMYHCVGELGGALVIVAGHNGKNLKTVWASFDKGDTLVRLADFPGAATHAATMQRFGDALYFWGGIARRHECWRLDLVDQSKVHDGAPYNGVTNLSSQYTIYDLYKPLKPGKTISSIGLYLINGKAVRPRIGYRSSPGVFKEIYASPTTFQHPGGGFADFPIANFTVPGSGYYLGFTLAFGPGAPDAFAFGSYKRAMANGDISGNEALFAEASNGTLATRWTEV